MKIEIEVEEPYLKVLSKWASVSRTLNAAKQMCREVWNMTDDELLIDKAITCEKELKDLEPALNYLHQIVRNELWKQK